MPKVKDEPVEEAVVVEEPKVEEVVQESPKEVNGIPVPEGAGNEKNPVIPIENAVNPTSPIYQK